MGYEVALLSVAEPASHPASQPPSRLFFKVEYLSKHLLEHTQILNLSLDDQPILLQILKSKTTSNGRRPQNIKSGISPQPFIGSN